jgi:hypothetical protein
VVEPISLRISTLIWEYGIKPIIDDIKKEYGTEAKKLLKNGIEKVLAKLPFQKKELEVIETEIVKVDTNILTDKKKFLEFFKNNNEIQELMNEVEKKELNINIIVEKSYNEFLIEGNNNSITF